MLVASKVGNLHSKFGHATPLGSRVIRYVRNGRTDGGITNHCNKYYCLVTVNTTGNNNNNSEVVMKLNCEKALYSIISCVNSKLNQLTFYFHLHLSG